MIKIKVFIIYNIIMVLSFTGMAIWFNKWWIALLALLFMAWPTRALSKKFRVCDCCGRYSESGETPEDAIKNAERCGWIHIEETNKDFCPDCKDKIYTRFKM